MAGFDYGTAATPILKEVYLPAMQELLNNATPLLKALEKETHPVEGGNFVIAVHRGRNAAAGVGRAMPRCLQQIISVTSEQSCRLRDYIRVFA